jgi:hypothetical protein
MDNESQETIEEQEAVEEDYIERTIKCIQGTSNYRYTAPTILTPGSQSWEEHYKTYPITFIRPSNGEDLIEITCKACGKPLHFMVRSREKRRNNWLKVLAIGLPFSMCAFIGERNPALMIVYAIFIIAIISFIVSLLWNRRARPLSAVVMLEEDSQQHRLW